MPGRTACLRAALTIAVAALLVAAPVAGAHKGGYELSRLPDPSGLTEALFGSSVAMSSDGLLVGGPGQSANVGAAWVYRGSGPHELTGGGEIGAGEFGKSAASSADGATALLGAPGDNKGVGAAFVFARSGETWTQQAELKGVGESGEGHFGRSVALSADGNTALVIAPADSNGAGAAWVFKRSGEVWSQQAGPLKDKEAEALESAAALSADGNTVLTGAWVFTRSGEVWTQQGSRLRDSEGAALGATGALSSDGNTAMLGAFAFTRSGGAWTQQGTKLKKKGGSGANFSASSPVALSSDGNTALLGEPEPAQELATAYVFRRSAGTWSNPEIVVCNRCSESRFGEAVALSSDATSGLIGAPGEFTGEAFTVLLHRGVTSVSPNSGTRAGGITVTVTGTGFAVGSTMKFKFGKALAGSVNCASTTSCTMVVPPSAKAATVDVIAGFGTRLKSQKNPGDKFTYH